MTVLAGGQVAVLGDFARLTFRGKKSKAYRGRLCKEMGHRQPLEEFVAAVRGQPNKMLTWEETSLTALCTFAAQGSIRSREAVDLLQFRRTLMPEASA